MDCYTPTHFDVEELFPEAVWKLVGKRAFRLIPPQILFSLDYTRDLWGGPIFVNDRSRGQDESGLRCLDTPTGARLSRHKPIYDYCQGFDIKPAPDRKAAELWEFCRTNAKRLHIGRMEALQHTPTWVHVEYYTTEPSHPLIIFKP